MTSRSGRRRKISSITDYFVVATGTSEPHLRAIVDEITDTLEKDFGLRPRARDGSLQTAWVVLDYFDVIVHVMRSDVREHYKLEDLWGDAPRVRKKKAPSAGPFRDGRYWARASDPQLAADNLPCSSRQTASPTSA